MQIEENSLNGSHHLNNGKLRENSTIVKNNAPLKMYNKNLGRA